MINPSIFKAYDVRGVYPSEINEEAGASIAKALVFLINAETIVVGRDARTSSPSLHKAIVDALKEMGVKVMDIGICPTPLVNYAVAKKGFSGGIIISASHNPGNYNGLKLIQAHGIQLHSPGKMDDVKKLALRSDMIKPLGEQGSVEEMDIMTEYIDEVTKKFVEVKDLKIVVDYGNGMGSITAKPVFEKLGLQVIPLYEEVDCTFPNHPANPHEEKNFEELRKKVVEEKADLGIFFDGDADRSSIVADNGDIIYPDILSALIIPEAFRGRSEKKVYYDLRFSRIIKDVLEENDGEGVMMRVGNPYYKEKLRNEGGLFAVELSGHMMFQEHYCIDDGLYSALKIMEYIKRSNKKLSELVKPLLKYHSSPEINMKVANPDETLEKVRNAFSDGESLNIDGVYIKYSDWWFSLRKSNTEPVVRLRLEADSKEKFDEMKEKIVGMIQP